MSLVSRAAELARIAHRRVQMIKLADIISNTSSIAGRDPELAKGCFDEKHYLLSRSVAARRFADRRHNR